MTAAEEALKPTLERRKPAGLFIAGANTDVGKTWVACAIARHCVAAGARVGVYKPAASGAKWRHGQFVSGDAEALWEAAGRPLSLEAVCPQIFEAPLAPHLAAKAEGKTLDDSLLRTGFDVWDDNAWDVVIVEGAGGLLSPISDHDLVADLALTFGLPVLLVVPNRLGMIGLTLQTVFAAAAFRRNSPLLKRKKATDQTNSNSTNGENGERSLRVAGVVVNQPAPPLPDDVSVTSNRAAFERCCAVPVVAELEYGQQSFEPSVDWWEWIQASQT